LPAPAEVGAEQGIGKAGEMGEGRALLWAGLMLLAASQTSVAEEKKLTALQRQGRALAERLCAQCHAVGTSGSSPHAAGPTFRSIGRRVDLDTLSHRLREGLISGHPDMPTFRFKREDARALVDYLHAIQAQ
jgi:mono/diheme cytochrome c family protein